MFGNVGRWVAAIALGAAGLVLWTTPAQAAPAGCPAHPAQFVGKTVHIAADADDDVLQCANLAGAKLDGLDLEQFNLQNANLTGATLVNADLLQADLTGATLTGAKFDGATMTQATLKKVNAAGASFTHAKLGQAMLIDATLTGANLTDAYLSQADLTGADLSNAILTGADFDQATMVGTNTTGVIGKPASADGTDLSTGISLPHLSAWVGPGAVLLIVFIIAPIVAARRARRYRTMQVYARAAAYRPQPGPGFPTMPQQPGVPTALQQPGVPTVPQQPGAPTVPQQARPSADLSSVIQSDAPAPYIPTVPEFPAWQPMTTTASMAEASHVVEEAKEKRWFGKQREK